MTVWLTTQQQANHDTAISSLSGFLVDWPHEFPNSRGSYSSSSTHFFSGGQPPMDLLGLWKIQPLPKKSGYDLFF